MLVNILQFCGGIVLLVLGGRFLVNASVDTARRLKVSPLVVGLTLVAWGTSAPELALNLISAAKGRGEMAVGNVVGANICNIALVLGLCSLIRPLVVQERLIKVEIWLNAAILGAMALLAATIGFERWMSALMLGVFGAYSTWTIMSSLRESDRKPGAGEELVPDTPSSEKPPMTWALIAVSFAGGLVLLSAGGTFASDGAAAIAIAMGVPQAVVGVTIVAIGTTMPEMVTGVLAVRRGQTDIAMGNALGSCLFNAGAIFGITSLIAPPKLDGSLTLPVLYMGGLALALVPISRAFGKTVSRFEGAGLLASYIAFLVASALSVSGGAK